MSAQHTPGPWFIWQELAMQRGDYEADEIECELLEMPDHSIYAGDPVECTRGRLKGYAAHICDVDADAIDFDDDEELSRATALANARLIAAAPELLEALKEARRWIGDGECSDGLAREHWTPQHRTAVDLIDAAIAKVEGGAA